MRSDKNSLPNYARGTYDKGMINAFIEKTLLLVVRKITIFYIGQVMNYFILCI